MPPSEIGMIWICFRGCSDTTHRCDPSGLTSTAIGFSPTVITPASTGDAGVKQTESWGIYREMRDDHVNFTNEWSSNGNYVYEYTMRATSVGSFARPPAVTELMYDPATRGQTAADVIEVKAK